MDDVRLGIRIRALRHRRAWRQADLAARAGVSQGLVSLIERGRVEAIALGKLRRLARELDADLAVYVRWRGGDLDRLVDEGHAHLVGRVVELLKGLGRDCRVEASFSIYGERGSIDVLAWNPGTSVVLVVEVKTELVSVEETLRRHHAKARLAIDVALAALGVRPRSVSRLLVLPALATPRRRVRRHEAVLTSAYPLRGRELRRWLSEPDGSRSGLLFIDSGAQSDNARGTRQVVGSKRIRAGRR